MSDKNLFLRGNIRTADETTSETEGLRKLRNLVKLKEACTDFEIPEAQRSLRRLKRLNAT